VRKSDCPLPAVALPRVKSDLTPAAGSGTRSLSGRCPPETNGTRGIMSDGERHIDTTRARAGQSNHMVRVILPVSVGLVIVAFAIILLIWH
jgi:hypothetical protein